MGLCWCKEFDPHAPSTELTASSGLVESRMHVVQVVDQKIIDQLVLEALTVVTSDINNDEGSPGPFVRLQIIADKEEGWIQIVVSITNMIPLEDPFGPSAIILLLDDCPLPSKDSVIKMTQMFGLSAQRANSKDWNLRIERNICIILACIAEKLVGPNSVAVFTDDTLRYLLTFLINRRDPCIVLSALIALEKFAHTMENKLSIKDQLNKEPENPLLVLEKLSDSEDYAWRQVGFCAQWMLDNLFVIEGRTLSYEVADMSDINAILNPHDASEYLKISCDGLEARSDSYSFESVRCTFQVDEGCWYYEAEIVTPGVMQIGWATRHCHFLNEEGFGIGDDMFSISYDGSRKLIWYMAKPSPIEEVSKWKPGDILGCLLDLNKREVKFDLNGYHLSSRHEIFNVIRDGFFAAASFMTFQQCRFNFGDRPFKYPPTDRIFSTFNDHGYLTEEQKMVVPRRIYLEQLKNSSVGENSCTICCDETATCVLQPCGHRGFCTLCTSQLDECPMCRAAISNVKIEIVW